MGEVLQVLIYAWHSGTYNVLVRVLYRADAYHNIRFKGH